MLGIALGAAAIAVPEATLPITGLVLAAKGVRALIKRRRKRSSAGTASVPAKAPQEDGSIAPVTLQWQDLSCMLNDNKGNTKHILQGVSGCARPGRLVALMGPSGSGKTSLLNALAGQVPQSSKLQLSGLVTVNGAPATERNHKQAYVSQEDVFYSMLTVSETLRTASHLMLPHNMPDQRKRQLVDDLVARLGLAKVSLSVVGDAKTRGLSGGEKKRLSIGCELIGSPSLIFLDEPTTGLDAFQAQVVVSTLKALAQAGHTVVTSIHQPRSSIFGMFDDLVLLSEGRLVYSGDAQGVLPHVAGLGHRCPQHFNPAEFVADLISIDFTSAEAEQASRQRVQALVQAWQQPRSRAAPEHVHRSSSGDLALLKANTAPRAGPLRQFRLLFLRSWRQVTRDRPTAVARAMANISSALIFSAIFFRMKRKQSSVQDRLGLLQVAAINTAMSSLVKTLNVFPRERLIVSRERSKGCYAVAPYLSAKLLAELPLSAVFPLLFGSLVYPLTGLNPSPARFLRFLGILSLESFTSAALGLALGACAPSTEAAVAIGPAVMVVFIVFGGYYVNAENVPAVLRWLPRASLIKQAFEALCINEFQGLQFEADAQGGGMRDGQAVLQWLGFEQSTIGSKLASEARILLFYYWLCYNILRAGKPRFQQMEAVHQLALAEEEHQEQRDGDGGQGEPELQAQHLTGEVEMVPQHGGEDGGAAGLMS